MIIDFNRYNGGGGSGSGVTPEQVQQQIDSALTPFWDSAVTESAITEAVSGLATEQYVQDAVSGLASEGYVREVTSGLATEQYVQDALSGVSLEGYWNSAQTEEAISAATSGKADAANVSGRSTGYYFPYYNEQGVITGDTQAYKETLTIHMSDGSTSSANLFKDNNYGIPGIYVATKPGTAGQIAKSDGRGFTWADDIYTPTSGFSTINGSAITNGGNIVIQGGGGDMSEYWNSAQTKTYVDSADTALQDQIDTMDEVVSQALVDLNGRVDEISGATQDIVTSTDIKHIVKCTQAEYDDPSFIWDPETLYIIVNNSN